MPNKTRRQFLEDTLLAAAAAAAAGAVQPAWAADEAPQSKSPNERLSVAVVGVNGQGKGHLAAYSSRNDTEVTYVCDADATVGMQRVEEVAQKQGRKPKFVQDLRRVLEDKSVDIVTTATPNHWHASVAIWSLQAGKDVYVEKPVSHNVSEGRRIVETARKYSRICQTGTQSRSNGGCQELIAYVQSGKLGEVKLARGLCYKPRNSIGEQGAFSAPAEVDYNLWSGPAPLRQPIARKRFHYDWHWFWDYGNGDLGNQGIHQMDIGRWGLGADKLSESILSYGGRFGYQDCGETANTQVIVHNFGDKTLTFEVRGLKTNDYKGAKVGVIFYGSEGYAVSPSYESGSVFDNSGKLIHSFNRGGDHHGNFLAAVRSREVSDLNADILEGHLSSALCHTGNISYRLGDFDSMSEVRSRLEGFKSHDNVLETFDRTSGHLKENGVDVDQIQMRLGAALRFDPQSEKFKDNSQADAMLTRQYREPFVVPAASAI